MVNQIAQAKRFAEEPERIRFTSLEATFRGDLDTHTMIYQNGQWHCSCRFFNTWGDCSHTMAMQRVLGVTLPHRLHNIQTRLPGSIGIYGGAGIPGELGTTISRIRGIQIKEEPLTFSNLSIIISALNELHTKCWLILKDRFDDLIEYTQTHNNRFDKEAGFVIAKVSYNSPFNLEWKIDASPQAVMIALATGIDAIVQAPQRREMAELEIRAKSLEMKINELEAHSVLADKEQERQLALQKAALDKEVTQLEIEKHHLEVEEKRLEVEKKRIDYALDIAQNLVNVLRPDADEETKSKFLQTLIPNLLQLSNGKGLELVLLPSIGTNNQAMTEDD